MTVFLYFKAYSNVSEWSDDFCCYLWEEKWQTDAKPVFSGIFLAYLCHYKPYCWFFFISLLIKSLQNDWKCGHKGTFNVLICRLMVRTFMANNEFQLIGGQTLHKRKLVFKWIGWDKTTFYSLHIIFSHFEKVSIK